MKATSSLPTGFIFVIEPIPGVILCWNVVIYCSGTLWLVSLLTPRKQPSRERAGTCWSPSMVGKGTYKYSDAIQLVRERRVCLRYRLMRCVSVETLRWLTVFLSSCSDVRPSGWLDSNYYYFCCISIQCSFHYSWNICSIDHLPFWMFVNEIIK